VKKAWLSLALFGAVAALAGGWSSSAKAYGGDGHMGVYQVGVSFNCDNRTLCVDPETGLPSLGGFWGWLELDNASADGLSGVGGDGEFAGCGHGGGFNGAGHTSYDIDTWWIAPDPSNAGLPTFFVTGTETDSFRGQSQSFPISGRTGIPAFTVHRPILQFFGQPTPPGMSLNVQVSYKPAR
jgi:hypothetical protein